MTAAIKLKDACSLEEKYDQPRQHIKKQRRYFANTGPSSQIYGFSRSRVWMWKLNHKESWVLKNWCFWTGVGEDSWESLGLQGDRSWISIGRNDAEAEAPILWPPDAKNWLIGKDPDAGKDWRQEEKGITEDEMIGGHHQFDGLEFDQALGVGDKTGKPGVLQSLGSQRGGHD